MSVVTRHSWRESLLVYTRPRVIGMLFLGFSAGLPFLLVFSTLTAWLTEAGISRSMIGFFAWVGITYSIKFFWAPVIDRITLPLIGNRLGHRRSWMLLAQIGIATGLLVMASLDPGQQITLMAMAAVWVAFSSATQDIVIDAYRIEAIDVEYQAAMAGAYQAGWRIGAALVGGAACLYLAEYIGWNAAYTVMAACTLVGMITVLVISEPVRIINHQIYLEEQRVIRFLANTEHWPQRPRRLFAWIIGALVCPFVDFFQRNGKLALAILLFIGIYRISDITLAVMANPFYLDLGFSKTEIANVTKIYGVVLTIVGAAAGGIFVLRFGVMQMLLIGAILVAITNLLYAGMVPRGHDMTWFIMIICADNFSGGFASSAFIAYLSGLTNTAYTATQYALFSSLMTLPAKFLSGFSGIVVDQQGYSFFFVYAACLGIPAILMVLWLLHKSTFHLSGEQQK